MKQAMLTIVTSIEAGSVSKLRTCLRTCRPRYIARSDTTRCDADMPLCCLKNLHFASFVIIDAYDDLDACLVFEATFDGPSEMFLKDFIDACSAGIEKIYSFCGGFPGAVSATPHLTYKYLAHHCVSPNAVFAGSPGRPVAQVIGESRLRNRIVALLAEYRRRPGTVPGTYAEIQRDIQTKVVRNAPSDSSRQSRRLFTTGEDDGFRWSEQTYLEPFALRYGRAVVLAGILMLLALASLLTVFILEQATGISPRDVVEFVRAWKRMLAPAGSAIAGFLDPYLDWLISFIINLADPVAEAIVRLVALWLGLWLTKVLLRIAQSDLNSASRLIRGLFKTTSVASHLVAGALLVLVLASWLEQPVNESVRPLLIIVALWLLFRYSELLTARLWPDPRDTGFKRRLLQHMLFLGRHITFALIVGLGILALVDVSGVSASQPAEIISMEALFDWAEEKWLSADRQLILYGIDADAKVSANWLHALSWVPFAVALIAVLRLRYWRTTLQMLVEFRHLPLGEDIGRRLRIDIANFFMLVLIWFLLAYAVNALRRLAVIDVQESTVSMLLDAVADAVVYLLAAGFYVLVVLGALYAAGVAVLVVIRLSEIGDTNHYADAEALLERPRENLSAIGREEHGINSVQNHMCSVTIVKEGVLRRVLLRLTLWVVNVLAQWWYNRGNLSGIPTILFARWVLLDRGRRLMFLTNYGGAWESYLNEFIDMGAVKGVNAIWSNTATKVGSGKLVGFPRTKFYFWKGAQSARAFKAYVRRSQVETIVWFSAYPSLSITNIMNNGAVRNGLFKPLKAEELDALARRL